jgi:hypothetical protein
MRVTAKKPFGIGNQNFSANRRKSARNLRYERIILLCGKARRFKNIALKTDIRANGLDSDRMYIGYRFIYKAY